MEERGFFRRWGLIVPAVLAPAIETAVVALTGLREAMSLAPQVTAPTPLGLFHDLRWVSVYHNSWPVLALEIIAVLVLRSFWVAWVVQRAWPDDEPPPLHRASLRAAIFVVIASFLLIPWVVLLFGMALTHVSFLFFVAVPPVIAIALSIHGGAASQAAGRWWRWRPTASGLMWILGAFVWLTAAGAIMPRVPLPVAMLVAATAGLANARAWYGIVRGIVKRPERRPLPALVPVTLVVTFAVVVGGSAIGFAVIPDEPGAPSTPAPVPGGETGEKPVVFAGGLLSSLEPTSAVDLPRGYVAWQFSYRGIDDRGRLLPYTSDDTLQPIMLSARRMAHQVEVLAETYRQPVTILAESGGALVARAYLTQFRPPSSMVERLVTLEMMPGEASVYLPDRGREGWGVGTGWALRGMVRVIDEMAPFDASLDAPLVRDLVECRGLIGKAVRTPIPPGIEEFSIEALADWVDRPNQRPADVRLHVVTSAHTGLVERRGVQSVIGSLLLGQPLRPTGDSMGEFVAAVAGPWRVPSLSAELFPAGACTGG